MVNAEVGIRNEVKHSLSADKRDVCSLCRHPDTFAAASEAAEVPCNVRKFGQEKFTVWRCSNCRSIHSLSIVDLDPYYRDYPFQGEVADFGRRLIKRRYIRRLRRAGLRPGRSLLDFGCGSGLLVAELRSCGYSQAVGYDAYSPRFQDRQVLERSYDFVVAQDVIEHVEDPQGLLARLAALTHPGGILCVGTPNAEGIDLSATYRHVHSLHQPYHVHILSARMFRALADELGLDVVHWYDTYYADTFIPFLNTRFMSHYARLFDNTLDLAFERPRFSWGALSPTALCLAFLGRLFPVKTEMMALLRRAR